MTACSSTTLLSASAVEVRCFSEPKATAGEMEEYSEIETASEIEEYSEIEHISTCQF